MAERFGPGDFVHNFMLPDVLGQTTGLFTHSRGNPMVLIFVTAHHPRNLEAFARRAAQFRGVDLFIVTRLSPAENQALANQVVLPWGVLSDAGGSVFAAYAGEDAPLTTYVLDRGLRVAALTRDGDGTAQAEATLAALAAMGAPDAAQEVVSPAPVLLLPRAIEPDFCREMIDTWHAQETFYSGGHDSLSDRDSDYGAGVKVSKVRRDLEITDPVLQKRLALAFGRRIVPAVAKAFSFETRRTTGFKIGRYGGEKGGYFRPHRDNTTKGTAHRRFAVTINLNAEDYEGGDLRFPEFGPRTYRAPTGGAVVFACSLLHEALPVTKGKRYAFLPFLYDDAAAKIREANLKFVAPKDAEDDAGAG